MSKRRGSWRPASWKTPRPGSDFREVAESSRGFGPEGAAPESLGFLGEPGGGIEPPTRKLRDEKGGLSREYRRVIPRRFRSILDSSDAVRLGWTAQTVVRTEAKNSGSRLALVSLTLLTKWRRRERSPKSRGVTSVYAAASLVTYIVLDGRQRSAAASTCDRCGIPPRPSRHKRGSPPGR